jgi:hypothetical protein
VNFVFPGNLPDGFDAHQRFQAHLGFEGSTVSFPFCFAHGSAFSHPSLSLKSLT